MSSKDAYTRNPFPAGTLERRLFNVFKREYFALITPYRNPRFDLVRAVGTREFSEEEKLAYAYFAHVIEWQANQAVAVDAAAEKLRVRGYGCAVPSTEAIMAFKVLPDKA